MLINLTNHPSSLWDEKQKGYAIKKYKRIIDLKFPNISPKSNSYQIQKKAIKYSQEIKEMLSESSDKNNAVHLMGELTFFFFLALELKKNKITVVVSTTERSVETSGKKKISYFKFIRFREI